MSDTVIQVNNLSKQYRLGTVGTGTLSHDINRWWHIIRGKEDPFLKIGEENNRTSKGSSDYVWALQDINFEVKQGEVLGIIGRNGAGKSTLLKILSRTTTPTTGSVKVKGRIASLLEVGTGFHPELTGRENIFLNGAIMGMTRVEIRKKFDEIVDFAGVERYIDTPVKRYSSGMYVRLAFAVAAHLEPEILIVDEVLAVGDAEFQKKCLGKMKDVSVNEGRTVLFVSHQMGTIVQLCNNAILMENGKLIYSNKAEDVISFYLSTSRNLAKGYVSESSNKEVYFDNIETVNINGNYCDTFKFTDEIRIRVKVVVQDYYPSTLIGIGLQDKYSARVCTFIKPLSEIYEKGEKSFNIEVSLPHSLIAPNFYTFVFALFDPTKKQFDIVENVCPIKIVDSGTQFSYFEGVDYGHIIAKANWKIKK